MAKKNKQSAQRHKQRQQKQQRRNQRVSKRTDGGYRPSSVGASEGKIDSLYLLDLKRILGTESTSFDDYTELIKLATTSEYLLDEPEFEKLAIAPLKAMSEYIKSAVELGFEDPNDLDTLPDEERKEKLQEILEETSKKLFGPELKSAVMAGLARLRLRWRAAHKIDELEAAAATQVLLENDDEMQIGHLVGIVRAMVSRAVDNGFELSIAVGMDQESSEEDELSALETYARIRQDSDAAKIEELLKRPGMEAALDQQLDEIWSDAGKALLNGALILNIYDEEELEQAAEIWQEVRNAATDEEGVTDSEAFVDTLHQQFTTYLQNLFTPERASALKERIEEVVRDPEYSSSPHVPALMMLNEDLKGEFDFDLMSFILFRALVGELRVVTFDDLEEEEA